MILSSFIPDPVSAAKQSATLSSKGQTDAQAQFDDALANVPDANTELQGRAAAADGSGINAGQQSANTTTLAATSFYAAVSNTQTSTSTASTAPVASALTLPASLTSALSAMTSSSAVALKAPSLSLNASSSASLKTPSLSLNASSSASLKTPSLSLDASSSASLKPAAASVIASQPVPTSPASFPLTATLAPSVPATLTTGVIQISDSAPTSSTNVAMAAPSTNLDVAAADGATTASTGAVSRRRSDSKGDVEAGDDLPASTTQGSAVPETAAPSLLSGLLDLLPTPVAQPQAGSSAAVTSQGLAKASTDLAAKSPLNTGGQPTIAAVVGAQMSSANGIASDPAKSESKDALIASATSTKNAALTSDAASVVKAVAVESHLAPSPILSPMQQVIDTVQKLTTSETSSVSTPAPAIAAPAASILSSRTMTLVLEPDNLGTVTVRLQLRGGSLDLQLDVASPKTLGLLTRDKDSLAAAMSGQDYQVGTLTMRASDTQTASQGNDNGTQNQDQRSGGSSSYQGSSAQQDGRSSQNSDSGSAASGGSGGDRTGRQNSGAASDDQALQREPRSLSSNGSAGVYI